MPASGKTAKGNDGLRAYVTALRIVVSALAAGVLFFAIVTLVIRDPPPANVNAGLGIMTLMGLVAAPIALAASMIVPAVQVKTLRRMIAAGTYPPAPNLMAALGEAAVLCSVYQTKTIIGAALLEGGAFLNLTAFMLEGNWASFATAITMAFVMLVVYLPRQSRLEEWIAEQERLMRDEKLLVR